VGVADMYVHVHDEGFWTSFWSDNPTYHRPRTQPLRCDPAVCVTALTRAWLTWRGIRRSATWVTPRPIARLSSPRLSTIIKSTHVAVHLPIFVRRSTDRARRPVTIMSPADGSRWFDQCAAAKPQR
jgi:hypothetical protein